MSQVTIGTLFYEAKQNGWKPTGEYRPREIPPAERAERERKAREAQERDEREAQRARKHGSMIFQAGKPLPPDHPYMVSRGVEPCDTLRLIDATEAAKITGYTLKHEETALQGPLVVVPIKTDAGLVGVELIDGNGLKTVPYGTAVKGGYWCPAKLPEGDGSGLRMLIGEGVATMLSARAATGDPCVAARYAGNLPVVAGVIRKRYPKAELIVLGEVGGGLKFAERAARESNARLPIFSEDANATHRAEGLEAVRKALEDAQEPAPMPEAQPTAQNRSEAVVEARASKWESPGEISAPLPPVPAFDPHALLPDGLRDWVMDEADRMPVPPDFVAAPAIVALGSVIGAQCVAKPKSRDDWVVTPNLWGASVGGPSTKKSPGLAAGLRPLDRLVAQAIEKHKGEMSVYETNKTIAEARGEAIETKVKAAAKDPNKGDLTTLADELTQHRQNVEAAPAVRRYKTNDSTVEKMGELLRDNPNGVLALRDEVVGLIASWDREGREGDRAFYLEAWNGTGSFDTDRIGRGTITIPNLCIALYGGIQPDKLTGYLEEASDSLANDGMLQRLQMLVYPDERRWEWRDRIPAKDARERVNRIFEAFAELPAESWGASPADNFVRFPYFRFSEEAQALFIEWTGELHRKIPAENDHLVAQHLAKFDKLYPALALIFHLIDCADKDARGPISAEAALRAAAWCDYLEAHARRCYGLLADKGLRAAQALAQLIGSGQLDSGFTSRDVRRKQRRHLKSDESVHAALDWLSDEGWLKPEEVGGEGPGTGRKTTRYAINPKVVKGGGDE